MVLIFSPRLLHNLLKQYLKHLKWDAKNFPTSNIFLFFSLLNSIFFIFFCLGNFLFFLSQKFFNLWNIRYLACKQNVSQGISTLMFISDGLGPYTFCQKKRKHASYEGRDRWERVLFPARVGISASIFIHASIFPYSYLDLACKQLFSRSKKKYNWVNWKHRKTQIIVLIPVNSYRISWRIDL